MSSRWIGSVPKWVEKANMPMSEADMSQMDMQQRSPRINALESGLEAIVEALGLFTQVESHYMDPAPAMCVEMGAVCGSCEFYQDGTCEIVEGPIDAVAMCHFFMIPGNQND